MIIFDVIQPTLGQSPLPRVSPFGSAGRGPGVDRLAFRVSTQISGTPARPVTAGDVLRHHREYRKAFPRTGITMAADALRRSDVATAVRTQPCSVDVRSCDELSFVLSVGIPASRIVLRDDGITAAPLRRAVNAGVGRLVLGCCQQVAVLAACGAHTPPVLVDVTTDCASDTIAAVLGRPQLELVGLHARLTPGEHRTAYAPRVARMIAEMAHLRCAHGTILTRVSLAGGEVLSDETVSAGVLRGLAADLEDTIDDACARYRFPRPAVILAPVYP